jgi:hypothetical protein
VSRRAARRSAEQSRHQRKPRRRIVAHGCDLRLSPGERSSGVARHRASDSQYVNGTIFARAPWPGWKHARLVIGDECLHCGRAIDPAAAWRVAIAVVGPDDQPGPERPLGVLHIACIAFYLAAQTPRAGDD